MHHQPGLSRSAIGEYLGLMSSPLAMWALNEFVRLFEVTTGSFDEVLRAFLGKFRLPGEVRTRTFLTSIVLLEYF